MALGAATAAVAAVLFARPVGDPPAPAPQPPALRIYSSLPVSVPGDGRGDLRDVDAAVRMAIAERRGRAGPHRIEHLPLDSASPGLGIPWEAGVVQTNARRAAADPRTVAYIGDAFSGPTMISAPVLGAKGVPALTPGAGYTGLTRREGAREGEPDRHRRGGPNLVRVIPGDHLQAAALVRWMRRLGTRRLIVLGDEDGHGNGMAAMVASRARAAGIVVVASLRPDPRRLSTVRRAVARAERARADTMLFTGIWQNRAAVTFNRMHRAVPRMRLMGTEHLDDPSFTRGLVKSARSRTHLTTSAPPPPARFAAAFERRAGHPPHPLAAYGHEAADLVLDTLATIPSGSPGRVRRALLNALFATRARRSALGRYSVDPSGDTTLRRIGMLRVDRRGRARFAGLI